MEGYRYLEELTQKYEQKAAESGTWTDHVKAHGLANACLAIESTEGRLRCIYDIERSFYGGKHPLTFEELQVLTKQHKQLLKNLREETKLDFDSLIPEQQTLDTGDMFSNENLSRAQVFSSNVFDINKRSTDGFVKIFSSILESSVVTLQKKGLVAPCSFAVIGLGSLARGEATPYSDLEYAFLVQSNTDTDIEYFTKLAVDSYFRIGNLGESPLKCFHIEELVNSNDKTLHKEPKYTSGCKIDGLSPWAGNIPTGNGLEGSKNLISTVDGLLNLYKIELQKPYDKIADLSNFLSSLVLIFANEDGVELFDQFQTRRSAYETGEAILDTQIKNKRLRRLSDDANDYDFLPKFRGFIFVDNTAIEVKYDIFRYPTLLATNLRIALNLGTVYPWDTFSQLTDLGLLSKVDCRYMQIVLALSIYIRSSAYLTLETQKELLSLYTTVTSNSSDRYHVPCNLFVILGCLLAPIKHSIEQIAKIGVHDSAVDMRSVLREFSIPSAHKTDFMLKSEVLCYAGDYSQALQTIYHAVGESTASECSRFIEAVRKHYSTTKSDPKERKFINICASLLYHQKKYECVVDYLSWIITYETSSLVIAQLQVILAECLYETKNYKPARSILNQVIALIKQNLELNMGQSLSQHILNKLSSECIISQHSRYLFEISANVYRRQGDVLARLMLMDESAEHLGVSLNIYRLLLERETKPVDRRHLTTNVVAVINTLAFLHNTAKRHSHALNYYTESLAMTKALYGEHTNHPDIATIYNNLGSVYTDMKEHEKALECLMKSLKLREALYCKEPTHPDLATCYNNIGNVYTIMGEYLKSLEYQTKALMMKKALYGEETAHPEIATSYNNIGSVYYKMRESVKSLEWFKKSLAMRKALYGEDVAHPDTATSYNNIGNNYHDMGDYAASLECHTRSLKMREALYGAHTAHPDIANSYNSIGSVYKFIGEFVKSLECHMKSLDMRKDLYANTPHPDIGTAYNNIGSVYNVTGNNVKSLEYHKKSLEVMKAFYGEDAAHPGIVTSYNNIGSIYNDMGENVKSLEYNQRSQKMMDTLYGAIDHADKATSYNNIGHVYQDMGDYVKSLEWYTKSLNMRLTLYGKNTAHPDIAVSYNNMGSVYGDMGNHVKSLDCYTKSLTMLLALNGEGNANAVIATIYNNMGSLYDDIGDYVNSLQCYSKSVTMRKSLYGENSSHPCFAPSYNNMGSSYKKMGQYVKALNYYTKSLAIWKARADESVGTAITYYNIGEIYSAREDYTTSLEFYNKALTISQQKHLKNASVLLTHIGDLYQKSDRYVDAFHCYNQALLHLKSTQSVSQMSLVLLRIAETRYKLLSYQRSHQFLKIALRKAPEHSRMLRADIHHLMGKCCTSLRLWRKAWLSLYSALCIYQSLPVSNMSLFGLAKVHYSISVLLMDLNRTSQSLGHSQLSLDFVIKLLADRENMIPEYHRLYEKVLALSKE